MKLEGDLDDPQVSEGSDNEGDELVKGYNFNLFHFIDQQESREKAFVQLTKKHTKLYQRSIDLNNYDEFLGKIFGGYAAFSVSYHNDIHALDVMQMSSTIMAGGMAQIAQLNDLEVLAVLIGAACHDFGHDGFNNQYHGQIKSDRF